MQSGMENILQNYQMKMEINRLYEIKTDYPTGLKNQVDYFNTLNRKEHVVLENYPINPKMDLVHIHTIRSRNAIKWMKQCRHMQVPFVVSTHGALLGYRRLLGTIKQIPYKLQDLGLKQYLPYAEQVIVNSDAEFADAQLYGIEKDKILKFFFPIDLKKYECKRHYKNLPMTNYLFVGNLSENRNVEAVIKELHEKAIGDWNLKIIGNIHYSSRFNNKSYIEFLMRIINQRGLRGKVSIILGLSKEQIIEEYKHADVFISRSVYESFGQCTLEAVASGLPIISNNTGLAKELKLLTHRSICFEKQVKNSVEHNLKYIKEQMQIKPEFVW